LTPIGRIRLNTPGAELDTHTADISLVGVALKHSSTDHSSARRAADDTRTNQRRAITLPARLTWKDQRGATRFATVLTRNVSDYGVYVECESPVSIPLFRLVQFQLERDARASDALPGSLQNGRVLGAVYRVSPPQGKQPQGLALRLMVDPRRIAVASESAATRATA
jgi:hypothetical protein